METEGMFWIAFTVAIYCKLYVQNGYFSGKGKTLELYDHTLACVSIKLSRFYQNQAQIKLQGFWPHS